MCEECPNIFLEKQTLHTHKYHAHNKKRQHEADPENLGNPSKLSKKENFAQEPMECKSCSTTFRFPSAYIKHYQGDHSSGISYWRSWEFYI